MPLSVRGSFIGFAQWVVHENVLILLRGDNYYEKLDIKNQFKLIMSK